MKNLEEGIYTGSILKKVTTEHFVISISTQAEQNIKIGMHSHRNPHFCFIFSGRDKEKREGLSECERIPGSLHFYRADEPHMTTKLSKRIKNINIELRGDRNFQAVSEKKIRHMEKNPHLYFPIFMNVFSELRSNDDLTVEAIDLKCLELITSNEVSRTRRSPDWASKLMKILERDWHQTTSLHDISRELNIHPVTVSREFKYYFGCNYSEYVRRIRILNSLKWLSNSSLSLTEITYKVGFYDQSHFIRNFKKYVGFLPKEFRYYSEC
ncbi:MAG: helix-turn-helix transcriptional regulator [Thermonemataceae bacterium]